VFPHLEAGGLSGQLGLCCRGHGQAPTDGLHVTYHE
jgi:hypothetical protein